MRPRIELHKELLKIMGNSNVYYQSPVKLSYPCIVYEKSGYDIDYANNSMYKSMVHYTLKLIGKEPDTDEICEKIMNLGICSFNRRYVSDNLYHDVFDLYY